MGGVLPLCAVILYAPVAGSASTKAFFTCLVDGTPNKRRLQKLKKNMRRDYYNIATDKGESTDHSCSPLYMCATQWDGEAADIGAIVKAYKSSGSVEGIKRGFAVLVAGQVSKNNYLTDVYKFI